MAAGHPRAPTGCGLSLLALPFFCCPQRGAHVVHCVQRDASVPGAPRQARVPRSWDLGQWAEPSTPGHVAWKVFRWPNWIQREEAVCTGLGQLIKFPRGLKVERVSLPALHVARSSRPVGMENSGTQRRSITQSLFSFLVGNGLPRCARAGRYPSSLSFSCRGGGHSVEGGSGSKCRLLGVRGSG